MSVAQKKTPESNTQFALGEKKNAVPISSQIAGDSEGVKPPKIKPLSPILENPASIPEALRRHPHWCIWRYEHCYKKKPPKVPYNPNSFKRAKPNDSSTWGTFGEAITAFRQTSRMVSDGIGLLLSDESELAGFDLDNCYDPVAEKPEPWAARILDILGDTYCEISPSGSGLRAFLKGNKPKELKCKTTMKVVGDGDDQVSQVLEIYDTGRYLTITGNSLGLSDSIAAISPGQEAQLIEYIGGKSTSESQMSEESELDSILATVRQSETIPNSGNTLDDNQVLERMCGGKGGGIISQLIEGDDTPVNGDASAGDMRLMNALSFWTNADHEQMDRIFRKSNRFREKWDTDHYGGAATYGQMTIARAIEGMKGPGFGAQVEKEQPKEFFHNASFAGELLDEPREPISYVLDKSLMTSTTGAIVGPPGVGKSMFVMQMCAAIATGEASFLGDVWGTRKAGKVIYLCAEDDRRILKLRLDSLVNSGLGCSFDEGTLNSSTTGALRENLLIKPRSGEDLRLVFKDPRGNFKETSMFEKFSEAVKRIDSPQLIVVDPLSRFYGGEENDQSFMTYFVSRLESIAIETGASVLIIHHVSKYSGVSNGKFDLEKALNQDAARGAGSLTAAVRWQLNLIGIPKDATKKYFGAAEHGRYLVGRVSKKNYGPPENEFFLERQRGGILHRAEPIELQQNNDFAAISEKVESKLIDLEKSGKRKTKADLARNYARLWKSEGMRVSENSIKDVIDLGLDDGKFMLVDGRGDNNRKVKHVIPATTG